MKVLIGDVIKSIRKEKGISQEALAEKMGVSVQAVSKWECNNSYPDIILLPQIAEFFDVSLDYLFYGKETAISENINAMPNDDIVRVVQYRGSHILSKETYNPDVRIKLEIDKKDCTDNNKPIINVEVWGSADIQGSISGSIEAGNSVNCNDVGGAVNAGDSVNCSNIGGAVNAGNSVNCGNVGGTISAGDNVNCGNVNGGISSGSSVNCVDIYGNILNCSGDVHCKQISGEVHCYGDIIYENK